MAPLPYEVIDPPSAFVDVEKAISENLPEEILVSKLGEEQPGLSS